MRRELPVPTHLSLESSLKRVRKEVRGDEEMSSIRKQQQQQRKTRSHGLANNFQCTEMFI